MYVTTLKREIHSNSNSAYSNPNSRKAYAAVKLRHIRLLANEVVKLGNSN